MTDEKTFLRDAGIISSIAEKCGLDWNEGNFAPIMKWHRKFLPPSEQNGYFIGFVGFSHGFAQGRTDIWLETNDAKCEAALPILKGNLYADNF